VVTTIMKGKVPADLSQMLLALAGNPQVLDALLAFVDASGLPDALDVTPGDIDTSDDPEAIISWINEHCRVISDQGRGIIPFTLYPYQRDVVRAYETHRECIVLKARQLGMTELTAAYALFKMVQHSHYTVVVFSKGENEAQEFLGKVRTAYDHLPAGAGNDDAGSR
jgi:hypothetical protein